MFLLFFLILPGWGVLNATTIPKIIHTESQQVKDSLIH